MVHFPQRTGRHRILCLLFQLTVIHAQFRLLSTLTLNCSLTLNFYSLIYLICPPFFRSSPCYHSQYSRFTYPVGISAFLHSHIKMSMLPQNTLLRSFSFSQMNACCLADNLIPYSCIITDSNLGSETSHLNYFLMIYVSCIFTLHCEKIFQLVYIKTFRHLLRSMHTEDTGIRYTDRVNYSQRMENKF